MRAIILTGAGKGFCAGLDLKEQGANANGNSINGAGGGLPAKFDLANSPPVVLHQTDKPVICALNGAAAGYGMDLALGCDIRIAAEQRQARRRLHEARRAAGERRHVAAAAARRLVEGVRDRVHGPHADSAGVRWSWVS